MPDLPTSNATKKSPLSDDYVSSLAEEPVGEHIGAFDTFWLDLLYGPRFRPVTGNISIILPPSPLLARTISRFASIKKVRAVQVMDWRHHWDFGNITCVAGICSVDEW